MPTSLLCCNHFDAPCVHCFHASELKNKWSNGPPLFNGAASPSLPLLSLEWHRLALSGSCALFDLSVSIKCVYLSVWTVYLLISFLGVVMCWAWDVLCFSALHEVNWRTQYVDAAVDWPVIYFIHFNRHLEAGFEWFLGFRCCFQFSIALPENCNDVEIFGVIHFISLFRWIWSTSGSSPQEDILPYPDLSQLIRTYLPWILQDTRIG